ncbi:MAG TPA: ABC transporter permease [Syntrophomonas sp.]|jgi:Fe-S cluster assembly scaffold protein SufB|nr:ABC transporter permease [Syntrophomonas sp.]
MKFDDIQANLLKTIANLDGVPQGAVNIRIDGSPALRHSSPNIQIIPKQDKPGFDLEVAPGTKGETVHVPVILTKSGLTDMVYNTFIIGEAADVTIIAGCGIHNSSHMNSQHDGIHEFILYPHSKLRYVEKHYGEGSGQGKKILNPTTTVQVAEGATIEMEMVQIAGVDDAVRTTTVHIQEKGYVKMIERLLTHGDQHAESHVEMHIDGPGGSGQVLSRSVAKENSEQVFRAALIGKADCAGHVECDSIIMDHSKIRAIPQLVAEDANAVLTHEAAIGRIAGEQLIKLMSLGLTEQQAIDTIIEGFLR